MSEENLNDGAAETEALVEAEKQKAYEEFVINLYKHMGSKFPSPDEMYLMLDKKSTSKEIGFESTIPMKHRFSAIASVYLYNCGIILDRISNQLATQLNQNERIIQQNDEINAMLRKFIVDQHAYKMEKETTKKKETSEKKKEE